MVNDHIRIMAVMHLHRKPGYWQSGTDPVE